METNLTLTDACCDKCWHSLEKPCNQFVECMMEGPFCHENGACKEKRRTAIRGLTYADHSEPLIFVGAGTCGLGAGAGKTLKAIEAYCKDRDLKATVVKTGCIGLCSAEPIVDIKLPGKTRVSFSAVTEDRIPALLDNVLQGSIPKGALLGQIPSGADQEWQGVLELKEHPFFKPQIRFVLENCGIIDPENIHEYIARRGYQALSTVLSKYKPADVCSIIERSGLRGRGGGGFPTGKKWQMALAMNSDIKYFICNADEGDPGAFMDRAVIEGDPNRLLEGLAIAAYAIGASKAYVYIRAEYPLAIKHLESAIRQAKEAGLLGHNILDSGFSLEIVIKQGAGAFVCGEETALIHSIEGKRGMPRIRPPYPSTSGLFGKPTVINNVETLANVPFIILEGAEAFNCLGTAGSKGTKVFALSGMVNRTGLVEVPMGTSIRRIVYEIGGGILGGKKCKGAQMGGPAGGCIPEQHLDVEIDYESLKQYGAIMGSGGMVVLDEGTCMVDLAKYFMEFIQKESCGKCIPCREGTKRMLEILTTITQGRHKEKVMDALERFQGILNLEKLAKSVRELSLCGLGQAAPNPVLSTLRYFRNEYEAHIFDRTCEANVCRELTGVPCQNACPIDTEVWRYVANIAKEEYEEAYRIIRTANPFPSVCARVCNHPCEVKCRSGATGGKPVAVRMLKRFVVDNINPAVYSPVIKKAAEDAPKVAVVGGGPAGLTAAHLLSANGVKVTIFEKENTLGGMLVSAIPSYRLPRDILKREIESLLNENIEVRLNQSLGKEITPDSLLSQGYKAVYLAMGAHESQPLGLENEQAEGIYSGLSVLKEFNLHDRCALKGHVGVIGGGNSAIDSARVALRQKDVQEVTVFYRRSMEDLPAYKEEVDDALLEGVKIVPMVSPVSVQANKNKLESITLIRNRPGALDASGRPRPEPIPGSEFTVNLDCLVVSIGEKSSLEPLKNTDLMKSSKLTLNRDTLMTQKKGVFAGGDLVTGPNTVVDAIASGKKAAEMIYRYVYKKGLTVLRDMKLPEIYVAPVDFGDAEGAERVEPPKLELGKRLKNFLEVECALTPEMAKTEACRCLRCDLEYTERHP